jgi:holo-[acyl-carrier protein] synthase
MLHGIGTDIVEIKRIKAAVEKWGDGFLKRIFTENEISYCFKNKNPYPCLAGRFAVKEAFIKALSMPDAVSLSDIEVLNEESGKPLVKLSGNLAQYSQMFSIHLSLSHERHYSVASVALERLKA